jgi:Fur family ferric uptake transcriptional regulator
MQHCFIYICKMNSNHRTLHENGLKATPIRITVLEYLQQQNAAFSHSELEKKFPHFNRVTLYRTLVSFEEKGLVHRVIDESGGVKYSSCSGSCDHSGAHDQHLHFNCEKCNITVCIEELETRIPVLPKGYIFHNYYTLATGICPQCAA